MTIYYELTDTTDPEERVEDAALFKAMFDAWNGEIEPTDRRPEPSSYAYGRPRRNDRVETLAYWNDPAFLRHARREFAVHQLDGVATAVHALHARGRGAFLKSTRSKHWIGRVPVGTNWREVMGDMTYSFIDGPGIMVQELVPVRFEWRFFVIGREIVTHSPNAEHLTPIDHPCADVFDTPGDREPNRLWSQPDNRRSLLSDFSWLARQVARDMQREDAVIDIAEIGGKPGVVELNPMVVGGVGLFAADVRALAAAIKATHPRLAR